MASGDSLFVLAPQGSVPTATAYATHDLIAMTGSTPDGYIPVLDFDGATDEHAEWHNVIVPEHYSAATGFTWVIHYAMTGTDGNAVEWEVRAFKLVDDDALATAVAIDGKTETAISDTPIAVANDLNVTAGGTMAAANAGTPAAGDLLVVRITRDISAATNTDDAQLIAVHCKET